jgi:hypothetical protein
MPQYEHSVGTIDVPLSNAPVPPFNREMTTTLPAVRPEVPDSVIVVAPFAGLPTTLNAPDGQNNGFK